MRTGDDVIRNANNTNQYWRYCLQEKIKECKNNLCKAELNRNPESEPTEEEEKLSQDINDMESLFRALSIISESVR